MYLTVREIIDLADFVGLTVTSNNLTSEEMDDQVILGTFTSAINENGVIETCRAAARCDGCEVLPLGEPIGGEF